MINFIKKIISVVVLLTSFQIVCFASSKDKTFSVISPDGQSLYLTVLSEQEKTVALSNGKYKDSHYTIPGTIEYDGYTYTIIEVAQDCFEDNKYLESISLPNTILKLGESAFSGAKNLRRINLPASLKEIDRRCFVRTNIESLSFPSGVKIGSEVIWTQWRGGICALKKLYVPDSCEFEDDAFMGFKGEFIYFPIWKIDERKLHKYFGAFPESYNKYKPIYIAEYERAKAERELAERKREQEESERRQAELQAQIISQAIQAAQITQQSQPVHIANADNKRKEPASDVDINIPSSSTSQNNTFAVIFANENYQEEVAVEFALNDGEMFKVYCNKVLGLPEENIHFRSDATLNNIKSELTWIQQVADAYKGSAKFIVYYAGHGIPDESNGTSYLLPVDGKGTMLESGYSLAEFYKILGDMPSEGITIFLDACFSGSKRGEGMLASARGVAIKSKPSTPKGKMVVFSAAQGDETAFPYKEKEHGLFTYYLLKKLQESEGIVSLGELSNYITEQVSRKSIVANSKSQTPAIIVSPLMGNDWMSQLLK